MATPSLLLIPDRYKAAKLYSQIPDSGAGDLTFARNSSATRVNSAGLIEKVRTNLQTYSQNFAAAGGWGGDPITATANYGTAPDGTTTSTRLVFTSANHVWQKSVTGINGNLGVFSLYIKGTAGETIQIAYGGTDKLVTIGTGWTRVNTNGTVASTGTININTYGGTARDFEVWGGQTELGDIATPYIPTTTAAVSVGITADIPRLDYTGGGCPSLLLEPQRTNLVTFSEQFDNAGWGASAGGFVRTANATISPDGTMSADRIQFPAVDTFLIQNTALTAGTACAGSVYIKGTAGQTFSIAPGGIDRAPFTLNGQWQRITHTATAATDFILLGPINGSNATDVFLWGAQLEVGSYPTSYIPTLGASVTRLADVASKTGISSLIGQTAGTIYWDVKNILPSGARSLALLYTSGASYFQIYILSNGNIRVDANGSLIFAAGTLIENTRYKIAFAYQSGNYALYLNGTQLAVSSSTTFPASLDDFYLGNSLATEQSGAYNASALYTTRLSNAELATLTAL